jgi:predicted amidohydrolase
MKISTIQTQLFWEDIEANLLHFNKLINKIDSQTDLIILPEMFSTGFTSNTSKVAENENGKAFKWLKNKALERKAAILASIIFNENGIYKNRLFFVKPDGSSQYYDKRHLFGTTEKNALTAGTQRKIIEYQNWKILPLICYDLRFPVWSRCKNDYDLLIYIANWPSKRIAHWRTLLQARAIENQCYTIGVNRIGNDGNGYQYNGNSLIISPKGEILNSINEIESIEYQILNKTEQDNYRHFFAIQADADKFNIDL